MKKTLVQWVSVLMFTLLFSTTAVLASENEDVEIILQIGNDTVYINGEASTLLVEPYISNSATLVPLRVITESFGATVGWNQATRTVSLMYEDKFIQLTIDHPVALVNGEEVELQTAAELKNGTTMVPIRMITENFGAVVEYEAATKLITIVKEAPIPEQEDVEVELPDEVDETSEPEPVEEPDDPEVDEDEWTTLPDDELIGEDDDDLIREDDKIFIGDSYYNWMMNYPPRLSIEYQSIAGSPLLITDANDQFYVWIQAIPYDDYLENESLLELLSVFLESYQRVLDKRWVSDAEYPYGLIVSKDSEGGYFEERIYFDARSQTIFIIILYVFEDDDFEDSDFRAYVSELLDSFALKFESSDEIQDVTKIEDGYFSVEDDLYGITFKLPYEWAYGDHDQYYESYFGDHFFAYTMSSIREDEMLRSWVARNLQDIRSAVGHVNHIQRNVSVTIDGVEGLMGQMSLYLFGEQFIIYDYFIYKGDYKYNFTIGFHSDLDEEEREEIVHAIVESLVIGEPHSSVGFIEE